MFGRSTLLSGFLGSALAVCLAGRATAELMSGLFPDGVPGYDAADGVTVETRLHPEQMPLGLHQGAFRFLSRLDESVGYTSNAIPGPYRRASWQTVTAPSLTVDSDWSRDALGAAISVQNTRYRALASQDRTDASASAGGRIDIGDDKLTLAAAHIARHEDRSALDSIASDRPIAFTIDDVRAAYAINDGRWSLVPAVQATNWTYNETTILGSPASQAYRDRTVLQGSATMRYEFAPRRSLVFVLRAVGQDYTHTPAGQPSPNSTSYQVLEGIDYDDDTVWRWRLLVGGEIRQFASRSYPTQDTLIAEAGVGWSPSAMTNLTATISRDTEDAAQEGVSGLVYSAARLTIDHEYLRDLLLSASASFQRADFFQGGHQTGVTAGLAATWVIGRNVRITATYDQSDVRGSTNPSQALVSGYNLGIGLVTMHLAL